MFNPFWSLIFNRYKNRNYFSIKEKFPQCFFLNCNHFHILSLSLFYDFCGLCCVIRDYFVAGNLILPVLLFPAEG